MNPPRSCMSLSIHLFPNTTWNAGIKACGSVLLQCSTTCGNGIQTRQDFCLSSLTHKPVNPLFCRRFPKAIVVRGCSAGPCPEQEGTQSPGAELQPVPPATHLPTAAAAPEHRHKDLDVPLSAGPWEQIELSGGEEGTVKRSFLCAAGLWGSCCQTGIGRECIWLGGKTCCSSTSMLPELGTKTRFPVLPKTLLTWEPVGQQLKASGSV